MNTQPLFSTSDRLERARVLEQAAEQAVAALATAYIDVHARWREAELAATKAALRGQGAAKRRIADMHRAALADLEGQTAVADASLTLARSARVRIERESSRVRAA